MPTASRAKRLCITEREGAIERQFQELSGLVEAVKEQNPGTLAYVEKDESNHFSRFMLCLIQCQVRVLNTRHEMTSACTMSSAEHTYLIDEICAFVACAVHADGCGPV
eukprot:10246-Eustigmatos_ZCMA.PRE.1